MATLDLLTETGTLLGFLLLAGPGGLDTDAQRRDCTFAQATPPVEHELTGVIAFAQGRPYRCNVRPNGDDVSVLVHIHEGMSVVLLQRADGSCQWHVEKLFGRSAKTGQCRVDEDES